MWCSNQKNLLYCHRWYGGACELTVEHGHHGSAESTTPEYYSSGLFVKQELRNKLLLPSLIQGVIIKNKWCFPIKLYFSSNTFDSFQKTQLWNIMTEMSAQSPRRHVLVFGVYYTQPCCSKWTQALYLMYSLWAGQTQIQSERLESINISFVFHLFPCLCSCTVHSQWVCLTIKLCQLWETM
jgi:hypothetical protein